MDISRYVFMTVNDFRPSFFKDPRSVSLRSLCGRVGNVSVVILATLL